MSGINQSKIRVTLRNPLDRNDQLSYTIQVYDNPLARDWVAALKQTLQNKNLLEKNFCFMGFPRNARTMEYLCDELNKAVHQINKFSLTKVWQNAGLKKYIIEDHYTPQAVRFGLEYEAGDPDWDKYGTDEDPWDKIGLLCKHNVMNRLHNYFEQLQGTVENLSPYYKLADYETKYAIRQLNNLCHELENLILSQRKEHLAPEWIRPSQITTFLHSTRYPLTSEHRQLFLENGYDRRLGHVYMHWTQIGKTLFEVFRDEGAPELDQTVCEAISQLQYYSGEFDIEWGADITYDPKYPFHTVLMDRFYAWLEKNGLDKNNPDLCLGYLPIGEVELMNSFGTCDQFEIWRQLSSHLDIYSIEVDGVSNTFDYCWSDRDYKQQQIDMMRPGYDHSSRG